MKRGLPKKKKMRHDAHFVETLVRRSNESVGTMLPMSLIDPNPEQPRTQLGNLQELTASIREKGVLEPILVRALDDGRYQIISGERRFRAATEAGLDEIPAIELDADDSEVMEIALVENIQRKDLSPFEEAEGFLFLQERFGYTHERISEVIGKSRTTITETLQLNDIPDRIRALCREHGVARKSLLVQIARAKTTEEMEELVTRIAAGEMTRDEVRSKTSKKKTAPKRGRPKNFRFTVREKDLPFKLDMQFKKADVEREEIIEALEAVLERLRGDSESSR